MLALITIFSNFANAEVRTIGKIKADVPANWTTKDLGNGVVAFFAPNNEASLSVTYNPANGKNAESIANELTAAIKGSTTPIKQGDDVYRFEFTNANGAKSKTLVVVEDDEYCLFTVTDPSKKFSKDIEAIIDSIESD